MVMSIVPVKYPRVLQNQSNGNLDTVLLKPIGDRTFMLATPADWYGVMQKEFLAATGRHLSFTYGGGYRTWDDQYRLFISRYVKVSYGAWLATPSKRRKRWLAEVGLHKVKNPRTSYWVKRQLPSGGYPATAAVPGESNHGIGLAVDLAIGTPDRAVGLSTADRQWLEANVHRFGFSYESLDEPWHVRYVMGDVCPPYMNEKH